jgi:calcineurin-like phosphoesterase family protein
VNDMPRIFLISDNHFSDYDGPKNVIDIFQRKYPNSSQMNADMIVKWNSVVRPDDVVFSIGDFAWTWDEFQKYANHLNGKKYFVMGNHDLEGDRDWDSNAEWHDSIFPIMSVFTYKKRDYLFVHRPEDVPAWWKGWVIHGHHHWMLPKFPFIDGKRKNINVACELVDYTPVDLDWILSLDIDSIVRMDTVNDNPVRRTVHER